MRGLELGEESKIWKEVASSEARLTLMKTMIKNNLAFADLESFGLEFNNKLKSIKLKDKTLFTKVSQPAMKAKLADEQMLRRELMKIKMRMKKNLAVQYEGEKTRKYKRIISYLNNLGRGVKKQLHEKYKKKVEHLKEKYKACDDQEEDGPPDDLEDYADLSVYNSNKFKQIEVMNSDILVIGDIELSDEEKEVLKLHTKFSILENLKPGGIDADLEASIAKLRMESVKDKEYENFTNEERKECEEIDAKTRMIFDPTEKLHDNRKRRVTDLRECSRITLPKPLTPDEESRIEVRKRSQKEINEKFRANNTNAKHEQNPNLKKSEKNGLKSLLKRIKDEEIIIMKTDKSGKFVVTTPEKYVEMGEDHTSKDIEITWAQMRELEKNVSAHSVAWEMIWNTGEDHNHQDRVIRSKNTRSGNQANLKLLFKDHKQGNKTRPVASGNESYNIGLSNGISDLLESVAKVSKNSYAVISSEDMLARVTEYNNDVRSPATSSDSSTKNTTAEIPTPPSNSEEYQEDKVPEDPTEDEYEEMSLVGSDVVALFPSITAERSARIVREEIERSEIMFEGFDDEKARAYINMNKEIISDYEDIAHLLPKRKAKTGTAPTMSSIGRKWIPNNQWEFPDEKISPEQTKKLIGLVAEIATIILFTNFSYKFGGKFYKQSSGGPIGVRATGAVAQLVMENWARRYREILERSGLTVSLMAGYVDDGRQVTSVLKPGMRFCKETAQSRS